MRKLMFALLIAVFMGPGTTVGRAQATSMSPQQRQAIVAYQLTLPRANQLIVAMLEMTRYVVSLPDYQNRMVKSMKMTPAERRAQLEKDPKAMAILKAHALSVEDYLVGVPALRMALMAAQGVAGDALPASPANLAFARANLSDLKPKMDAADGIGGHK